MSFGSYVWTMIVVGVDMVVDDSCHVCYVSYLIKS
jgi:hypothetical protein